jgi:hypothetical protein
MGVDGLWSLGVASSAQATTARSPPTTHATTNVVVEAREERRGDSERLMAPRSAAVLRARARLDVERATTALSRLRR